MPLRCIRKPLLIFALAMSAGSMSALAADASVRISLSSKARNSTSPQIAIDGGAPSGCVPRIGRSTLDGADLSIELNAPSTGCRPQRTVPYHLRFDTATVTGVNTPPPKVLRVRVFSAGSAGLVAFRLLDTSTREAAASPENGFWWSQAGSELGRAAAGSGMSLEFQDGHIAASLLGFSETGAATWYFGSAGLVGNVARIPLVQLANGDGWFSAVGTQPEVLSGPRMELEFLSPTRALAYLVRNEDGRDVDVRSLVLTRSVFSSGPAGSAWSGRWVLVAPGGGTARVFDFVGAGNRDGESFRLVDTPNAASLECRFGAGTTQPEACTLTALAGATVEFDQVGLDHLTGHNTDGAAIQLLRVPQ